MVDSRRIFRLNGIPEGKGPVIYWMSRDQRAHDNWALLFARELALKNRQPLHVVFCLTPGFLNAGSGHYRFMLQGLKETERELRRLNINFMALSGFPPESISRAALELDAGAVVADFGPLRIQAAWKEKAAGTLNSAFLEVDAHNIVPCRAASRKQEYAAYTFRPKIKKLLKEFLKDFPEINKYPHGRPNTAPVDWESLERGLETGDGKSREPGIEPGSGAGLKSLKSFIRTGLSSYEEKRNNPVLDGQSGLSPYLHFGQVSAQRAAVEALKSGHEQDAAAFLEELTVRKELSDNFCFHSPAYDSPEGFPAWAKASHLKHSADARTAVYPGRTFEESATHDELWNAAQTQLVKTGKMHGFMRMYWAKKILEWTNSPAEALETAVYLNDKYELDGRDPNGYAGIMWAVGGVHDRAWPERPVFGKIRYMSYNGCRSKFNVSKYISRVRDL